ncbi:Gfo/Idh/MocA family protein [Lacrimispora sp.]|uniref:Gfo/Idh/MocA family protein n=1 Tax=Lacrimispora sp. TaxID=2719234 RepID=UPI0039917806
MVRVGVIGCGNIGRVHAMSVTGVEGVCLCAVADIKRERAKEFSDCFTGGKAAVYGALKDMLEMEELDVIHICTPHNCHVPMAVMGLKKGISVFMEKPPAITRAQFEELLAAEKESRGRLGICFQNRYNETTKKVSQILKEGTLGRVKGGRAFVTWNRCPAYYTESGWRGGLHTEGGGVLINQSIHTLDLLLHWLGKPVRTEAAMSNHHLKGVIGVEDTVEAYMEFTEGEDPVRASFYATTAYGYDAPVLLELVCEKGVVRLEGNSVFYRTWEQEDFICWKAAGTTVPGKTYWGCGHEACIRDFYKCLADKTAYRNDLPSVENTFYTMMDIYDSARNKER